MSRLLTLIKTPFFRNCTEANFESIEHLFEIITVEDETFIKQGQERDKCLYIVLSGEVCISQTLHGITRVLRHLTAGKLFGLASFISEFPRLANYKALGKTELARLPYENYETLIKEYPRMGMIIKEAMHLQLAEDFRGIPVYSRELPSIADGSFLPTNQEHEFLSRLRTSIPDNEMQDKSLSAKISYKLIDDELNLDGVPILNLGSFVTTWMEDEAQKLALDNINKNFIDINEYPKIQEINNRVIDIIGKMFHCSKTTKDGIIGATTIGSSEAIILALLAHKWQWKKQNTNNSKKPNIIMSRMAHACWFKFAKYFDVEARLIDLDENHITLTVDKIKDHIDENTIAVGCTIGDTFTGCMDDIIAINELLEDIEKTKGLNIPIHVDAASSGFILPFTEPDFPWDFRLSHVRSINVSNSKYGLVYPGLGTLIMRDETVIPEDLVFQVDYLVGTTPNYSLNFSKNASNILLQYYNLIRFGKEGYQLIMREILENARFLCQKLSAFENIEFINKALHLPILAFTLKDTSKYDLYWLSENLRHIGWMVPAYPLPKNRENTNIMRIVIKENFSRRMIGHFINDLKSISGLN